jgi:hypothetical protein
VIRLVIIVAVIVVLAVPAGLSAIWALHRFAAGSARLVGAPDAAPERVFLGGSRSESGDVTWPLARLEFFGWGIRIVGSVRPVRWLIGTWEARYEELATVRFIASMSSGIRFAVKGGTTAVVFWAFNDLVEIADRLEERGVTVDRSRVSLRQAGGIYRTR